MKPIAFALPWPQHRLRVKERCAEHQKPAASLPAQFFQIGPGGSGIQHEARPAIIGEPGSEYRAGGFVG